MPSYLADLSNIQFSLETIYHLVVESIATLGHGTPAERAWVVDAHQEDRHLST